MKKKDKLKEMQCNVNIKVRLKIRWTDRKRKERREGVAV
jgi:hypothetical protein